jgi:hypothetical protein
MSRVIVHLGTQLKEAPAITEPMLSSEDSLVDRGKAELYHECVDRYTVDIDFALYSAIPFPGDIIKIKEDSLNLEYLGVVTSFSISQSTSSLELQGTIERPIL